MSRKFFSIENLIEMVYQFIMGEKYKSGGGTTRSACAY